MDACQSCLQVDRNATVEIKISEDNRQAHFDFERSSPGTNLTCLQQAKSSIMTHLSALTVILEHNSILGTRASLTWKQFKVMPSIGNVLLPAASVCDSMVHMKACAAGIPVP